MKKNPNPTLAGFLSLLSPPLGMLYAAQAAWAAIYLVAYMAASFLVIAYFHRAPLVAIALVAVYVMGIVHAYRLAYRHPEEKPRPRYSRWYGLLGIYLCAGVVIVGLRSFAYEIFLAPSGSMVPSLEVGTSFVVQKWGYGHYDTFGITLSQRPISSELRRGDVVVFDRALAAGAPAKFVMRLIGLPGDTVAYRGKKLSINGKEIAQASEGSYTYARADRVVQHFKRFSEALDGSNYSVMIKEDFSLDIADAPTFVRQQECVYEGNGETCKVPAGHYFVMGDNRDDSNDSRYWGFVPEDKIVGKVVYIFR